MSIDNTSHSFSISDAKTEIRTIAKGAWILLAVGLVGGLVMLVFGSDTIQGGDIANGAIRLAISAILFEFGASMIFAVGALHLHLAHLRAIEQISRREDRQADALDVLADAASDQRDQLGQRRTQP
jgi:uncharacterized membrane protein